MFPQLLWPHHVLQVPKWQPFLLTDIDRHPTEDIVCESLANRLSNPGFPNREGSLSQKKYWQPYILLLIPFPAWNFKGLAAGSCCETISFTLDSKSSETCASWACIPIFKPPSPMLSVSSAKASDSPSGNSYPNPFQRPFGSQIKSTQFLKQFLFACMKVIVRAYISISFSFRHFQYMLDSEDTGKESGSPAPVTLRLWSVNWY